MKSFDTCFRVALCPVCPTQVVFAFIPAFLVLCVVSTTNAQGSGVVEGKLVNRTDPKIVGAGVEIDVIGLGGGMSVLKSTVTDSAGRFRIEGLPTDSPMMIRANYRSVNYHGRINFDASGKANVEVEIFEPTTSMKRIRVEEVRLGFQLDGEHLRALETYSFVNETSPMRTFISSEGNFRFSKPEGIAEPPRLSVQAPGAAMPLAQSPLESADGQSYYTLYPLRPGKTAFELDYILPYHDRKYTFRKKFFHDIDFFQIGVIPQDVNVEGAGLKRVQVDTGRNFAVYTGGPVKAGGELIWTFSGGTPVASPQTSGESRIRPMLNSVGRYAFLVGPLLLMAFVVVLWYAYNNNPERQQKGQDPRTRELKARRDRLLDFIASLDDRFENKELDQREYQRLRSQAKRQLRRIALLLGKK